MDHSVTAYLERQSTQTLNNLLQQYMYGEEYYQQLVPVIVKILEDREKRSSAKNNEHPAG